MARRRPSLVFLIRLWPAENGGEPAWRASLESIGEDKKLAFASLEDLFACIRQQVTQAGQTDAGEASKTSARNV